MGILSRKLSLIVLMAAISPAMCPADAGEAWPQRTIKVIIPLPAGGTIDTSARLFAEQLSARWGQPVVFENMPGADGIIAVNEFVKRRDNHTLIYSFAGLSRSILCCIRSCRTIRLAISCPSPRHRTTFWPSR